MTDSTNLTDDYTRNRIRHGIVPRLREINGSLEQTMRGTLDNLREDNALISKLADELYASAQTGGGLSCAVLLAAEPALSGRAIRRLANENGAECPRETVLRIRALCENGGKLTLGRGRYAVSDSRTLRIEG